MEVLCAAFRSSTRARCKMSVPSPPDVLDRPLPNLLPWRRCRLLRTRLKPCGEWESGLAESNLVHRWKNSRGESRPRLDPVDQIRFERRAWRSVRAMSIAFQIASPQGQPSETRLIPVIVDSTGLFARSAPSRECGLARRAGAVDAAAVRSVSDSRLMTGPGAQSTPGQRTAHPRTQDLGPAAASTVFRSANHRQVVTKLRASSRSSEFAGTRPQALDSHMFSFRYGTVHFTNPSHRSRPPQHSALEMGWEHTGFGFPTLRRHPSKQRPSAGSIFFLSGPWDRGAIRCYVARKMSPHKGVSSGGNAAEGHRETDLGGSDSDITH
jgi:hypothetical protein